MLETDDIHFNPYANTVRQSIADLFNEPAGHPDVEFTVLRVLALTHNGKIVRTGNFFNQWLGSFILVGFRIELPHVPEVSLVIIYSECFCCGYVSTSSITAALSCTTGSILDSSSAILCSVAHKS